MSLAADAGPSRQYNLVTRFQQDLLQLLNSGNGSDILFVINGETVSIPAHSSVIAVRCKSLRARIVRFLEEKRAGEKEVEHLEIPVRTVRFATFRKVLTFIYTGLIGLEASEIFDVSSLAGFLGIESLQKIVFSYLQSKENVRQIAPILDRALESITENHLLVVKLTQYFAENCSIVLKHAPFAQLSRALMVHLIKQENLWASELEIWQALVAWSCAQCNITPAKKVSEMTTHERGRVSQVMQGFCEPGYLRILNFDANWFAREVEPLGVFPSSEVLLKYRFEATAGMVGFDSAFPLDRYSFLTRIRQRTMCFESSTHPHPRGVSQTFAVELPVWVSETKVVFDSRTALGRYADLEFFADEERTQRIFSVRASRQSQFGLYRGRVKVLGLAAEPEALDPVYIRGNTFWCSFYAPKNVGDLAWGYKFFVSIVR